MSNSFQQRFPNEFEKKAVIWSKIGLDKQQREREFHLDFTEQYGANQHATIIEDLHNRADELYDINHMGSFQQTSNPIVNNNVIDLTGGNFTRHKHKKSKKKRKMRKRKRKKTRKQSISKK